MLVSDADVGKRLDLVVSTHLADCSRSYAAELIRKALIIIKGRAAKPGYRVKIGEEISGRIPAPAAPSFEPEALEFDILYEDEHLLVLDKPPGMVVHPAPGHASGTLVNGLLHHCPELKGIGGERRPGIVHRLDKDTSGAMVVAKHAAAQEHLARQFKTRRVQKHYLALVYGEMPSESGTIALPIGRHPVDRKRMSTVSRKTRSAETRWRVKERFGGVTWLELELKTGRTHQIRVHCAALHHPIVGDTVYAGRRSTQRMRGLACIGAVKRQMLHARHLTFIHPVTGIHVSYGAPVPADMATVVEALRAPNRCGSG